MSEQPSPATISDIRGVLGRAGQHLYDLAREVISENDDDKWRHLSRKHNSGDISEAIAAILQNWDAGFSKRYSLRAKDLLRDVRELRNKWAHPTPENEFDRNDAFRLLDSLSRVLRQLEINDSRLLEELDELKNSLLTVVTVVEPPVELALSAAAVDDQHLVPERQVPSKVATYVGVAALVMGVGLAFFYMNQNPNGGGPVSTRSPSPSTLPSVIKTVQPNRTAPPKVDTAEDARQRGMRLYREAEAHFQKSGDLYARDVMFKKAIEHFEKASWLAPEDPEPIFNRAVILEAMNRRAEARDLFKTVVALSGEKDSFIKTKSKSSIARINRRLGTN